MQPDLLPTRVRYRTLWLSDVHLGYRGARAERLLDLLHGAECETLYLVGDIVDMQSMRRRPHWPQAHNNVLRTLLGMAKRGTRIVYVPGNHDALMRQYAGSAFGNIRIEARAVHVQPDGRRLLVVHGDAFDAVVRCPRALAAIGSRAYDWLLHLQYAVNGVRARFGFPYWSLAAAIKGRVANAMRYIERFEAAAAFEAARLGLDGVVCGHIHRAGLKRLHGVVYANCGDWVESCTALVERRDGALEILDWREVTPEIEAARAAA